MGCDPAIRPARVRTSEGAAAEAENAITGSGERTRLCEQADVAGEAETRDAVKTLGGEIFVADAVVVNGCWGLKHG